MGDLPHSDAMGSHVDSGGERSSGRQVAWCAVLLLLAGGLVYSNAAGDAFIGLDAKQSIRDNPHIRNLWPLSEALSLPLYGSVRIADQHPTVAFRPSFSLVLALTHALFGMRASAFHAVALAIHVAAALAFFGFLRRASHAVAGGAASPQAARSFAFAASLLWLVHPLQTESVTYFVQMCESLMGLGVFACLYACVRAREGSTWFWHAMALVAAPVSIGSKQTAIVLPLLVFLADHVLWVPPSRARYRWGLYGGLALFSVAAVAAVPRAGEGVTAAKVIDYAVSQPSVILHYLRLTFWPDDLYLYVNTSLFRVDSFAEAMLPTSLLVAAAVASLWALWHRHWLGFAGAFFFLTLAPTSSILPITDRLQEHRMYVPLAAVIVVTLWAAVVSVPRLLGLDTAGQPWRVTRWLVLALVAACLGARTYARNLDYRSEFTMVHPADVHQAYTILADHFLSRDELLATEAQRASTMLDAGQGDRYDRVFAHFVRGLDAMRREDWTAAVEELQRCIGLDPGFAYAHQQLGVAWRARGDTAAARVHLERALVLDATSVVTRRDLALVLQDRGEIGAAERYLSEAVQLDPRFAEGWLELGVLAAQRGDDGAAHAYFESALREDPQLYEAHYELGLLWDARERPTEALRHFRAAVRIAPDFSEGHEEIGRLLLREGDLDGAEQAFRQVLANDPESRQATAGLEQVRDRRRGPTTGAER